MIRRYPNHAFPVRLERSNYGFKSTPNKPSAMVTELEASASFSGRGSIHPRIIKGTLWLTKRQQPGSDQLWIRLHIPEDAGQSGEQFPWAGEVAIMGSIFACVLPQPLGGIELR